VGLKPVLRTTTSFSALTLLVGSFDPYKPVPDMTYNVFSGTLNPTQSINQLLFDGTFVIFLVLTTAANLCLFTLLNMFELILQESTRFPHFLCGRSMTDVLPEFWW